jgi:hypothetical protein
MLGVGPSLNAGNKKVIIVGDSHSRRCATELKHCLGWSYTISSFVQPGAEMKVILNAMKNDIKNIKRHDTVVIWGGAQDIGRNNSREALTHLRNFVENN